MRADRPTACRQPIEQLSECKADSRTLLRLPRGTRLLFPSGAALVVEEENPPCADMGAEIETTYATNGGEPAVGKMFGKHSFGLRGVVGVVDVPGEIRTGDRVELEVPKS